MDEPTLAVGKITKPHGLKGEVAVLVLSDNPARFAPGNVVHLEDGRALTIGSTRANGARLLVTFEGVADRAASDALKGALLVVPASALPALPEGTYWPHELEGCEIVTEQGRSLGTLTEVIENPANDLWVGTDANGDEILVPALRDVIVEVDLAARRVLVRDVPGITVPDED